MFVKGPSAWQFVTSASGGFGIDIFVAEGGKIYLQDPTGKQVVFTYGAAGAGISYNLKLPKIGKIELKGRGASAIVAPAAFPNTGKIYILETFAGTELTRSDITGVCMFVEAGGGLIAGGSATAMLLGMDPVWLAGIVASAAVPFGLVYFDSKLVQSATAVLLMAGLNVGIQAGAGVGGYLGGLY